jgi:hypothetical protein
MGSFCSVCNQNSENKKLKDSAPLPNHYQDVYASLADQEEKERVLAKEKREKEQQKNKFYQ